MLGILRRLMVNFSPPSTLFIVEALMEGLLTTENTALLERLHADSRDGFTAIFETHGKAVYGYAWKLADTTADAEEIVQETFLTLWAKRRNLVATETPLLPWLLATCRKHAANLRRRNLKHRADELEDGASASSAEADAAEQLAWIEEEISAMSPLDQSIARMCLIDGVPYKDAARSLGIGYSAIAKRIERTRTRLKHARTTHEGES
jgi:RNA polymerase sigma-70 factor (ECF subfamily)